MKSFPFSQQKTRIGIRDAIWVERLARRLTGDPGQLPLVALFLYDHGNDACGRYTGELYHSAGLPSHVAADGDVAGSGLLAVLTLSGPCCGTRNV